MFVLLLTGCADIKKLQNLVDTLANPLVMVGGYIGIEQPTDPNMDMSGSEFSATALVTTVLADAASVADMGSNPVGGAGATVQSPDSGTVVMVEGDGGEYTATSDDGLVYTVGQYININVDLDGSHLATIESPEAALVEIEQEQLPGEPVSINLTGQDFDSAFVVVYDVLNGSITFDNRPTEITDIYNWTHGDGTVVVDIPGSAFASESIYGVGVAGLRHSDEADFVDVNTLLSTFASGKFTFHGVYTVPVPPS